MMSSSTREENSLDEISSLRRTMRDLVALSALPAIWTGYHSERIAESLADIMLRILSLEFIYIRLPREGATNVMEVGRCSQLRDDTENRRAIGRAIAPWLSDRFASIAVIPHPLQKGTVRIASARFGYVGDAGVIVAGSLHPHFPSTQERLLINFGANQAALAMQRAHLVRLYAELSQENSERRKAEDALRAAEERWRKLFENSSAGIALIRRDGRCFAANLAFQKMLGYAEQELQRLTTLDLTLDEDRAADEALRAEAIAGQWRAYRVERRFRRKDGSVIWTDLSAVSVPDAGSESAFFSAVIVDITERKQAEEELRRSEAFLAQGQRISHTGSWRWQVATGSVYWSKEHFRIFGYDPETDTPSYLLFMEGIHPEDRAPFEELLNRAVRDKSDFENHYRIVLPGGSIKFLRSVGQALVNPSGELEFIGTVMDVTDLKRAEEMQIAIARDREMLMRQRAADLAKANEALRSCLDALASVPELDDFLPSDGRYHQPTWRCLFHAAAV
jgi:PAS domain S-box-containing protein